MHQKKNFTFLSKFFYRDVKEDEKTNPKKIIEVLEEEILLKDIFNLEQVVVHFGSCFFCELAVI